MQNNTALAQQILNEAREKRMNPIEMLPTAIAAVFGLWTLRREGRRVQNLPQAGSVPAFLGQALECMPDPASREAFRSLLQEETFKQLFGGGVLDRRNPWSEAELIWTQETLIRRFAERYCKGDYAPEALGCEIGNHTFSHADLTRLSTAQCTEEIDKTNAEFERVLGHPAAIVRPPYGFYNDTVRRNVPYPLVLWTVDTNDWKPRNTGELADAVVKAAEDGSVILMHDQQSSTAEAMDAIIPALIAKGFRFVTVSELIEATDGACRAIKMPGDG